MEIRGRKVTDVGLFQSRKGIKSSGTSILVCALSALFLTCFHFYISGIDLIAIPFLIITALLIIIAVTNMNMSSKLSSKDFNDGEMREIIISDGVDKETKYVAFLAAGRECPGCGSGLPSNDAKFCSECGHRVS